MRRISFVVVAVALGVGFGASVQAEDKPGLAPYITGPDGCFTQEGAKNDNGKWVLPDGTPTFHICKKDGTLVADWARITATAAITPSVTSAMAPMAWVPVTPRRSPTRSRRWTTAPS